MKVIDPGHHYRLNILDERAGAAPVRYLTFVKRQGSNYPGNDTSYPGTIIQDVVRCCIDRLKYLDQQIPHDYNRACIESLRSANRARKEGGKIDNSNVEAQCLWVAAGKSSGTSSIECGSIASLEILRLLQRQYPDSSTD